MIKDKVIISFFQKILKEKRLLCHATLQGTTISGYGFNAWAIDAEKKIYLHTGKKTILQNGDKVLCTLEESNRVEGRCDVVDYILFDDPSNIFGIILDFFDFEQLSLFEKSYWFSNGLKGRVLKKYVIKYISCAHDVTSMCTSLASTLEHDFIVETSIKALQENTVNSKRLLDIYAESDHLWPKLSEALWGKINDLDLYICLETDLKTSKFVGRLIECIDYSLFHEIIRQHRFPVSAYYTYFLIHYPKLQNTLLPEGKNYPSADPTLQVITEHLNHLKTSTRYAYSQIITLLPNVQLESLLEIPSIRKIFIGECLSELLWNVLNEGLELEHLLVTEFRYGLEKVTIDEAEKIFLLLSSKNIVLLLEYCLVHSIKEKLSIIEQSFWEMASDGKIESDLLNAISKTTRDALQKNTPDQHFVTATTFLDYDERRYCEYIVNGYVNDIELNKKTVKSQVQEKGMLQAWLLIHIHEENAFNKGKKPFEGFDMILSSSLIQEIFEFQSTTRGKIQNIIFLPCILGESASKGSDQKKLSVCEGKVIQSTLSGGCVMCRNRKCNKPSCAVKRDKVYEQRYLLFDLIDQYYSFSEIIPGSKNDHSKDNTPQYRDKDLHFYDFYLRPLAAINRWNEIMDRLHCRECSEPLEFSVHNKDSMGRVAYGVSYWHCSNNSCDLEDNPIKISHCRGCGKTIDSRDDTVACNPEVLEAYYKFYICNDCGSCCNNHIWKGTCPSCSRDEAFNSFKDEHKTYCQCRFCGHDIKPPKKDKEFVEKNISEVSRKIPPKQEDPVFQKYHNSPHLAEDTSELTLAEYAWLHGF